MSKKITIILLMVAAGLAQESVRPAEADRIRSVITQVNKARKDSDAKAFSLLFAPNGGLRVGNQTVAIGPIAIEEATKGPLIWSEVTAPIIEIRFVRFMTPDLAFVEATQTQYGSLILKQSVSVTLLMELDGDEWRILSMRLQPALGMAPVVAPASKFQ